jgi:hypothetical protein
LLALENCQGNIRKKMTVTLESKQKIAKVITFPVNLDLCKLCKITVAKYWKKQ